MELKRVLGPWDLILLGIGGIIGAGIFSITGVAAAENAGPAIVISFIFAAIGCLFAGLCYSELASMITTSGSAYTYAYIALGKFTAWLIGWALILEYAAGAATVSISWSAYFVFFLSRLDIHLPQALVSSPWQPTLLPDGTLMYGIINLPALFIVIAISFLLILGIRKSATVNAIMVVIKVAVVLIFIVLGYGYVNPENQIPFIPPNSGEFGKYGWSGIFRAAGVIFFAYIGFDAVSTAAQETKNPQRNIPIGILASLFICTILYILFGYVLTGLVNYKLLNVAAPVALAISQTPYPWIGLLIDLAIISGLASVILVLLFGQSRIFFIMSQDGMLPKIFATLHPQYQTPWYSNLILMILVGLFGAFAPLALVGHMTSIGTLLAFLIVCISVWVLRITQPDTPRGFKVPCVRFVSAMGILTCLALMLSLGMTTWVRLAAWLTLGLIIYFSYSRHHSK